MERLEARIAEQQKSTIQEAAELTGRSLTDFVVSSAYEAALKTLEQHRILRLCAEDSRFFVEKLLNPPKLGSRLKEALERHDETTGK